MSMQATCVRGGIQIDAEQYDAHLDRCVAQNSVIPNDSNIGQCPLCNQMVNNLIEHCQTCMIDNDNKSPELIGATSALQVYKNGFSPPGNLLIFIV